MIVKLIDAIHGEVTLLVAALLPSTVMECGSICIRSQWVCEFMCVILLKLNHVFAHHHISIIACDISSECAFHKNSLGWHRYRYVCVD